MELCATLCDTPCAHPYVIYIFSKMAKLADLGLYSMSFFILVGVSQEPFRMYIIKLSCLSTLR